MADVTVRGDDLHITLTVPERVLSLHSEPIVVPLARIAEAVAVPDALAQLRGDRVVGAGLAGVPAIGARAGTRAGRAFCDFVVVHGAGPGVVLTLEGSEYDRIVLAHPRPEQLVEQLR